MYEFGSKIRCSDLTVHRSIVYSLWQTVLVKHILTLFSYILYNVLTDIFVILYYEFCWQPYYDIFPDIFQKYYIFFSTYNILRHFFRNIRHTMTFLLVFPILRQTKQLLFPTYYTMLFHHFLPYYTMPYFLTFYIIFQIFIHILDTFVFFW